MENELLMSLIMITELKSKIDDLAKALNQISCTFDNVDHLTDDLLKLCLPRRIRSIYRVKNL